MNRALEMWSTPWRQLQRNLANDVSGDTTDAGVLFPKFGPRMAAPANANWLMRVPRARHGMAAECPVD